MELVCMHGTSFLATARPTQEKTAVNWLHNFLCQLLHVELFSVYFALTNLNQKLSFCAKACFSLPLILPALHIGIVIPINAPRDSWEIYHQPISQSSSFCASG